MKHIKLNDIAKIYNGNSINKTEKQQKYTNIVPGWNYIATKDVDFDGTVTYKNGVIIPYSETRFKIAPAGTVFVCSEGGSAGRKTAIISEDVCFGNKLFAIVNIKKMFIEKYVYYYTRFGEFTKQFKLLASTLMGGISSKNFGNIEIPLPSLPEQQRIVTRIEELFSELDKGVETLRTIQRQLAVYRQAVLKEAFEGKLTKSKIIRQICIFEFADVGTGATPLTSIDAYYGGNIPWVASGKVNDRKIYSPSDYITNLALSETNCKVFPPHTVLVAMYGEGKTRGKCAELMIPAATNQALAAIVLKENSEISNEFLIRYLEYNYNKIRLKAVGGVQPNINLNIIKQISLPLFSYSTQKRIVAEIESRLSVCDSIERTVETALAQSDAMRQSILKQAFEGGFTK